MQVEREKLIVSEQGNRRSSEMDEISLQILQLMNMEDGSIIPAIRNALPVIADAVDRIVQRFQRGGRLIYVGAGTSGRLAALDALECPPTFGTAPDQVAFLIAGGANAFLEPLEGAEDDTDAGARELQSFGLRKDDAVVAISASGSTPYCIGALRHAADCGAATIAIACNAESAMGRLADVSIEVVVGPEVLAGSTRLKAGTAQKIVLNMLSTASMVRTGRVYRNLMVDMQPSNAKLKKRAIHIVAEAAGVDAEQAAAALEDAGWRMKTAIVSLLVGVSPAQADTLLQQANGFVRAAIGSGEAGNEQEGR